MHPLDNVIWHALTTRQAEFAEGTGPSRRFAKEVSPLTAFDEENHAAYESLGKLVGSGGVAGLFLDHPYEARQDWKYLAGAPLSQMVCSASNGRPTTDAAIVELGTKDSPEMLELTSLTKPGPFGTRTHELGTYLGIRQNGKLAAMAGERLKVPGYTEVSAVCTHPDHTGKGYARLLMLEIMHRIRVRGETPFLHVRQDNTRAIELYKWLGFSERKLGHYAVLRRN